MLLKRFYHEGLAQASYLVGCQATGEALVVDPNRDIEQYVEAAAREGLRIIAVTETHIHADFVSGARELALKTGAQLLLSDEGPAEWKYTYAAEAGAKLLRDGDSFQVGRVRVDVMHTPGHTPEHLTFQVTDTAGADRPMGVFTGDFVFVGDVGRPDLLEKAAGVVGSMEQGAQQLYRSLQRFRDLPDYLQVWPGHGAGSACGRSLGAVPHSTVGYEKLFNWAFTVHDEDEFVQAVLEGQPEPPPYFAQMKQINKNGPDPRPTNTPRRGSLADLERALALNSPVVDVRPVAEYAEGHIPGTINIAVGSAFLSWAGWLLPYDREIGLIGDEASTLEARREMMLIGLDRVESYWTPQALDEWKASRGKLPRLDRRSASELKPLLERTGVARDDEVAVLDVRTPEEHAEGHIPGSLNIPLGHLAERLHELPTDRPLVVHCAGGTRSPIAASILEAMGLANVIEMKDGFSGWQQAGNREEVTVR